MINIYNDDCLEVMPSIPKWGVDLVLADIPFGTTRSKWDIVIPFEPMWEQINRVLKPNGACLLFGQEPFSSLLRASNLKNFKYDWVWDKVKSTNFLNAKKQPLRGHENISVFYRKQCMYNPQMTTGHPRKTANRKPGSTEVYGFHGKSSYDSTERYPRDILTFSTDVQKEALHPNQKPVALLEYFIRTYTNEGQTVLDFTMGSGSTGVACRNLGRNFIGIELDRDYFNIAKQRIHGTTVQTA